MKKLLLILGSFSFVAPVSGMLAKSFSTNELGKINTDTESYTDGDKTGAYFTKSADLSDNFTDIESIDIVGDKLGNYQGTLSVGFSGTKVFTIKSGPNGTVKDELFFDAGETINFFTGRGTTLTIYGQTNIFTIDCSSLGSDWLTKTVDEQWFDASDISSLAKTQTYEEVFDSPSIKADNTFVMPETNKVLAGYKKGSLTATIYNISDTDGSLTEDKTLGSGSTYPGSTVTNIYNIFTLGDGTDSEPKYFAVGKIEGIEGYQIWCLEGGGTAITHDVTISWNGETVESETGLPILLKVGKQLGFAYGTHLFFYSTETKHGDADSGAIDFVESDEVFTSTDGDLTYATAAVDPNENQCVLLGTEKGQFILRGNSPDIGASTITRDSFTELDKISNQGTTVSETVSPSVSIDNAKIYVKSGDGEIFYFQRKIDLSAIKDNDTTLDGITDSSTVNDKITAIDTVIEAGNPGTTMTPNDLVAVVGDTQKIDDFKPITNQVSRLDVKGYGDGKGVIIGETTFKIGTDTAEQAFKDAIQTLTFNLDKAFDADHGQILEKIKSIINDQKYLDETSDNYIPGLVSFTINDYTADGILEIGAEDNKATLSLTVSTSGTPDLPCGYEINLGGINKTALSISKDSGFSVGEDTSIKIDNWSDILKYKENHTDTDFDPATFKPEITGEVTADDTDETDNTDSVTSFAVTADAADDWSQYVSVTLDNNTGVLDIKLLEHNPTAINMTVKIPGSAIFDEATITFTVPKWTPAPPIPWALIGGIIGGILGAALLGFLIFAFIKWWLPILMAKAPRSKGKTREYSRRPQQKADANAVRHTKKIQVRRATTHNDAGIVRSGIFEREIDVNQEKFKNPNRDEFLGYMMDEDVVVNNWNTGVDPDKRPRISYEKKTQVDNHNKEIAKKMADKKSQIIKSEKSKK
jgi:hypothetical protein